MPRKHSTTGGLAPLGRLLVRRHRRTIRLGQHPGWRPLDRNARARWYCAVEARHRARLRHGQHGPGVRLAIARALMQHADARSGRCDPSYARLARVSGHARSVVEVHVVALEADRLVEVVRRYAKPADGGPPLTVSNAYLLLDPGEEARSHLAAVVADTGSRSRSPEENKREEREEPRERPERVNQPTPAYERASPEEMARGRAMLRARAEARERERRAEKAVMWKR